MGDGSTVNMDPPKKKSEAKGFLLGSGAAGAPAAAPTPQPLANPATTPSMYIAPRVRPTDEAMRWSVAEKNIQVEPSPQGAQGATENTPPIDDHPLAALGQQGKELLEERVEEPGPIKKAGKFICCDVMKNELISKALYLFLPWAGYTYPWQAKLGDFRYATVLDCFGPIATAWVPSDNFGISFSGRRITMHEGQESRIQAAHRRLSGIEHQEIPGELSQSEFENLAHLQSDSFAQPDPGRTLYYTVASIDTVFSSTLGLSFSTGYGPGFGVPEYPFDSRLITKQQIVLPTGEILNQTSAAPYWTNYVRGGLRAGYLLEGSAKVTLGWDSAQGIDYSKVIDISRSFGSP